MAGLTIGLVLGACVLAVAPRGLVAGLVLYLAGLALALRGMAAGYPHSQLGACNVVTTVRLALVGGIVALALAEGAGWPVVALATVALLLDGVDGWLARRQGLASAFGAAYDMEVDAAIAACLAVILLAEGRAGPELLLLGFARYGFVMAALALPWLAAPLEESFRRKAVCVVQIGTLVALAAPVLPDHAARPLALTAAGLVAWSFARDIRRLAAAR
jgi:phosphatidylglycerophosphate synthase